MYTHYHGFDIEAGRASGVRGWIKQMQHIKSVGVKSAGHVEIVLRDDSVIDIGREGLAYYPEGAVSQTNAVTFAEFLPTPFKIKDLSTFNSGGGCMLDLVSLNSRITVVVSDDAVGVYRRPSFRFELPDMENPIALLDFA